MFANNSDIMELIRKISALNKLMPTQAQVLLAEFAKIMRLKDPFHFPPLGDLTFCGINPIERPRPLMHSTHLKLIRKPWMDLSIGLLDDWY